MRRFPPEMKLRSAIAVTCVSALLAVPLRAQHRGGGRSGGGNHGGGGHAGGWGAAPVGSGGSHPSGAEGAGRGYSASSTRPIAYMGPASGRSDAASNLAGWSNENDHPVETRQDARGWQGPYPSSTPIRFTASMLPPRARGYSPVARHAIGSLSSAKLEPSVHRLPWTASANLERRRGYHRHFSRGAFEPFCGFSLGFDYCGESFFLEFSPVCFGANNWDASMLPALGEFYPCLDFGEDDQVSTDEDASETWDGPDSQPEDVGSVDSAITSSSTTESDRSDSTPVPADNRAVTLLQLKDGSMYGLVEYWVSGGLLNYITDYRARNAVPLDRIDLEKTVQLNSQRGVPFVLENLLAPDHR